MFFCCLARPKGVSRKKGNSPNTFFAHLCVGLCLCFSAAELDLIHLLLLFSNRNGSSALIKDVF